MTTLITLDIATAYAIAMGTRPDIADPAVLNPDLNIWFNSVPGVATATASGSLPFAGVTATVTAYASASGTMIVGNAFEGTATAYASASGDILLVHQKNNWVAWSNIGQMNFTVGRSNVAGERPLDWKGYIYAIKKLGSKAIAYGKNGVSALVPSGSAWGLQTIHRLGLKSKQAVAGDENVHFFINSKDQLFVFSDGLQRLDYSEYLCVLTSPVLSYEIESGLLYICDGTYGFVYSHADKSLGTGPVNITGISDQDGTLYAVSPATIVTPAFEICTDIYDMGTRRAKTIYSIDIGTDIEGTLKAAIDWSLNKAEGFETTNWFEVDQRGRAQITAYGREFRFRVKNLEYEYFELDYLTANGEVHNH